MYIHIVEKKGIIGGGIYQRRRRARASVCVQTTAEKTIDARKFARGFIQMICNDM
jgi:hypothetical protein